MLGWNGLNRDTSVQQSTRPRPAERVCLQRLTLMNPFDPPISRRLMLRRATQAAATASMVPSLQAARASDTSTKPIVWDVHGHLTGRGGTAKERVVQLLRFADRAGVDRLTLCMGLSFSADPTPERFRQENDEVLQALEHGRGRVFGFVYLNPKHEKESLRELDRCVRDGPMIGVKLWIAVRCCEPCLAPIVLRAGQLHAPIFQHTYYRAGGNRPGESTPAELAQLAARHEHVPMIAGHTGLDWERGIRAIRPAGNVFADLSPDYS